MRNNPLPADFAKGVMPFDDNGEPVITISTLTPYITAVLQHLQNNKTSLNTADFVDAVAESLDIDFNSMAHVGALTEALFRALIVKHRPRIVGDDFIYDVIRQWLLNNEDIKYPAYSRYKAILSADYPMPSTLNPKKIAIWRSTSKMGDWDKRQAVSVRKWIKSTLLGLTEDQMEELAQKIDESLKPLADLDIRHHSSYAFNAWERAYSSDKIRSCMHPDSSHEVGRERTFTCYCSGYHGLPDNGLSLTVLYQGDTPVARAITFTDDEQKYYVRCYGDDRLENWLTAKGYEQSDFAEGTILYTTEHLIKPYVDGDTCMSDLYTTNDGKHYWLLCKGAEYNLKTTDAFAHNLCVCTCCGYDYPEDVTQELYSHVNSQYYIVCDGCAERNSYAVYTGGSDAEIRYFHDGQSPDTNSDYVEYDNEYYEIASLHEYDLCMVGDDVYHEEVLYYCERSDARFTDSDDVYTDAEQISTEKTVHFPYDCVSREYWDENVVECDCGTLALSDDTRKFSTPSLGSVITLDDYWNAYSRWDASGAQFIGIIFELADIERDYEYDPTEKMKAFRDYAIAYNTIQFLRFQELGI